MHLDSSCLSFSSYISLSPLKQSKHFQSSSSYSLCSCSSRQGEEVLFGFVSFTGHHWHALQFIVAVTHPLQVMLWRQSGHVPADHLPPVPISKGAWGNLSPKCFSLAAAVALAQMSDVTLPSELPVPCLTLSSPVAVVLIDTDMKKGLCSGAAESECLAFRRGQTLRGRREQFLCRGWAPGEVEAHGPFWQSWAALSAQLTQLGPLCTYERAFFPLGWLFYFQIT